MESRKHVVIVGAGFGGLAAAQALSGSDVDVVLIDRTNHHLFQPLLYQVATAALSPGDIASASRSLFTTGNNVSVVLDEVIGVDKERRDVITEKSGRIRFDYLILATGADYSFFGRDDWAPHAPVLKTLRDALQIRTQLISAFEAAERCGSDTERSQLLTFVVVGGGPTGVELVGAIAELAQTLVKDDFRNLSLEHVRIMLIEAGPRLLSAFSEKHSAYTAKALNELGVDVRLREKIERIDKDGVLVSGHLIPTRNVFWAAGTQARPAGHWIDATMARNKAVVVNQDCSVPGYSEIYAIGDVSSHSMPGGQVLPGLAPVAKQQGQYVAKLILSKIQKRPTPGPFRYKNWGTMAVVGRSKAVADFGWLRVQGFPAWVLWSVVHLWLLVGFRSRLTVYVNWAWAWWTKDRGVRLLTDSPSTRSTTTVSRERHSK